MQFMKKLSFPLLRKLVGYILQSSRFREELFQETLIRKSHGQTTFLDSSEILDRFWNVFFQSKSFSEMMILKEKLESNLDELSKEVASRFFFIRYLAQLEGVLAFSRLGFLTPLRQFYPLDRAEQDRLIQLGKNFTVKYIFPDYCKIEKVQLATAFGLTFFPRKSQESLVERDIIDGGGFAGDSAMVFTEYHPKKIYVFEPNPDTFNLMQEIIKDNIETLHGWGDIVTVPFALGRSEGTLDLYTRGGLDGASSFTDIIDKKSFTHKVKTVSIDDYSRENSLDIGLIKLDVEGAESDVIEGAVETIRKHKPLLIISIYHTPKDFFEIKPKLENLNLGYKFMIRHLFPESPYCEYSLLAYPD
jgi:FkbM family methyltransferase